MRKIILWMLVIMLLAACGGGDEQPQDTSNNTTTNPTATAETVVVQNETLAASVNGESITEAQLNREIAIYQAGSSSQAADLTALRSTVLEALIEQKLIEQAAVELGIAISDEQVQAEISAMEAEAQQQGYSVQDFFAQQGIAPEEYPARLKYMLLVQAVSEKVTASVPSVVIEVHARHILVEDEALARSILEQLNNGADFAALAAQHSIDPFSKDTGGDLGWIAPGDLVQPEVEAAIFALPPNARNPEPVKSILGYHIIEALERAEGQPMDPAQLAAQRSIAWDSWLAQRRATATIERY